MDRERDVLVYDRFGRPGLVVSDLVDDVDQENTGNSMHASMISSHVVAASKVTSRRACNWPVHLNQTTRCYTSFHRPYKRTG